MLGPMHLDRIDVGVEAGQKRVFAWAVDWPGWARAGKTPELALDALVVYATRYATAAREAGLDFPAAPGAVSAHDLFVVDSVPGGSGTDFGVPSAITPSDRRPVDPAEAERLAILAAAAWVVFDRVAAVAPAELRKGPRGGGRDTAKVVAHVIDADHAYAREIGLRLPPPSPADRAAVAAERQAMVAVLGRPSDGSPLADRRWTARYAARRIAWHALDHAWEIEDRSEPG
jgi:hypothetical protein